MMRLPLQAGRQRGSGPRALKHGEDVMIGQMRDPPWRAGRFFSRGDREPAAHLRARVVLGTVRPRRAEDLAAWRFEIWEPHEALRALFADADRRAHAIHGSLRHFAS